MSVFTSPKGYILYLLLFSYLSLEAQWKRVLNPSNLNGSSVANNTVFDADKNLFVLLGNFDTNSMNVFISTDSGKTQSSSAQLLNIINDVAVMGHKIIFATDSGVQASVDTGKTWFRSNVGLPADKPIVCFHKNGSALYASVEGKIFKSIDSSASWTLAAPATAMAYLNFLSVVDSSIYTGNSIGLYKSVNGGNWIDLTNSLGLPSTDITAAKIDANKIVLGTRKQGVFISTDGGINWVNRSNQLPTYTISAGTFYYQVKHIECIGAIILMAIEAPVFQNGLFRSDDNGLSWQNVQTEHMQFTPTFETFKLINNTLYGYEKYNGGPQTTLGLVASPDTAVHWYCINFDWKITKAIGNIYNNKSLLFCSEFASNDNGETWFVTAPFASEVIPYNDSIVLSVTSSNPQDDTIHISYDNAATWQNYKTKTPAPFYDMWKALNGKIYETGSSYYVSTDIGKTWNSVSFIPFSSSANLSCVYDVTRLKVSHDEGLTFSTINFPLRSRDNILSYDALGDRLLVGARESGLFFSKFDGAQWSAPIYMGLLYDPIVSVKLFGRYIFVGMDGYIRYVHEDVPTNYWPITGSFSDINTGGSGYVNSISIIDGNIFASTNNGLWKNSLLDIIHCDAYYTTTYDSVYNTFYLDIDPMTLTLASSYYWDFGDGSTSTLKMPTHTYTKDSVYIVCMKVYTKNGDSCQYCRIIGKDAQGNIVRNTGFSINVRNGSPTKTDEVKEFSSYDFAQVFPNPFSESITILFENEHQSHVVKIFDVLGKEVKSAVFSGRELTLPGLDINSGVYNLVIIDEKGNSIKRRIVANN